MLPPQLKQSGFRFCKLNGKVPVEQNWQDTKNYAYDDQEITRKADRYTI